MGRIRDASFKVRGKHGGRVLIEAHAPDLVGLGVLLDQSPARARDDAAFDCEAPALEIDVLPTQGAQLAAPRSRRRRESQEHGQRRVDPSGGVDQAGDVGRLRHGQWLLARPGR